MPVKIHWFPSYSDLEKALVAYGFLSELSSTAEPDNTGKAFQLFSPGNGTCMAGNGTCVGLQCLTQEPDVSAVE